MNFDLDDEQRDVAATARDWFASMGLPGTLRGSLDDPSQPVRPGWRAFADMGFLGITVPEDAGGAGRHLLDLAVVAEQAGRVLAGPSLATVARAASLLPEDLLPGLADGSRRYAVLDGPPLAYSDGAVTGVSAASMDALGEPGGAGHRDAPAGLAYIVRTTSGVAVTRGTPEPGKPMDPSRGVARVRFTGEPARVLDSGTGAAPDWDRARASACVVLAAESLGLAARCVELGLQYARLRTTFGRPIGTYQAVKHPLVDAWVAVEQLRSLVWYGAWAAERVSASGGDGPGGDGPGGDGPGGDGPGGDAAVGPDDVRLAAAAAKAYADKAAERAASTLIQVLGGIGFTWEHDAHLYWRRAKVDRLLLGTATEHRTSVADLVLDRAARLTAATGLVVRPQPMEAAESLVVDLDRDLQERGVRPRAGNEQFRPPRGRFLVAELNGTLVGCVGVRGVETSTAEIDRLYVRPEARRRGVARALLSAAERSARDLGYSRLTHSCVGGPVEVE